MLEVRFRVIANLANWIIKNHDGVYEFISSLASMVKENENYDPTETEMTILTHFYDNYIHFMLSAYFISDIGKIIIDFLDYFESQKEVRVHKRYMKIVEYIYSLSSKFMKNGGLKKETVVTGEKLTEINFRDEKEHLDLKDRWVGHQAENFLSDLGLKKDSEEVQEFFDGNLKFYIELLEKAIKYFKASLHSRSLQYMDVLNPKNILIYDLDKVKNRMGHLARKCPNVIPEEKLDELQLEVSIIKAAQGSDAPPVLLSPWPTRRWEEIFLPNQAWQGSAHNLQLEFGSRN